MAKFSGFRTFKLGKTVEEVIDYLLNGLAISLKELQTGLTKLSFEDNFESQTMQVTLPAGKTIAVPHNLGVIPSKRLIVKANGFTIDDSDTPWTNTVIYLRNTGASQIIATIILMR